MVKVCPCSQVQDSHGQWGTAKQNELSDQALEENRERSKRKEGRGRSTNTLKEHGFWWSEDSEVKENEMGKNNARKERRQKRPKVGKQTNTTRQHIC